MTVRLPIKWFTQPLRESMAKLRAAVHQFDQAAAAEREDAVPAAALREDDGALQLDGHRGHRARVGWLAQADQADQAAEALQLVVEINESRSPASLASIALT